jgi:hypothetical protein
LEYYNNYKFSQSTSTRRQEFLSLEKEYLQPLPSQAYEIRLFKRLKVQKMGYIYLSDDKHYYSVPYRYIGEYTEVQYNSTTVEIYLNKQRIATHQRDYRNSKYTTIQNHLSSSHKAYSQWSLEFFQTKAKRIGNHTLKYITEMILQRPYPEVAYKQALGITLLTRQYPVERIDSACKRALGHHKHTYHIIENILKKGLDKEEFEQVNKLHIPNHQNIRGRDTYK